MQILSTYGIQYSFETRLRRIRFASTLRLVIIQVAVIYLKPFFYSYRDQTQQAQKCPVDPYFIVPDKCQCVDFQILKLQENPEEVPQGELPRHIQLYADRYLTDRVAPGNRVTVLGVFSIKKSPQPGKVFFLYISVCNCI